MAFEVPVFTRSYTAAADYSAATNQYKLVKLNANGEAEICSAVTDEVIGVLQNCPKPTAGVRAIVMHLGVSKVRSNAALAINDNIGTSADGEAAPYVHGVDTTKYIIGKVLEASGGAGEYATAIINCLMAGRAA